MISRRLLRIKVLQVLYAYYKADKQSIDKSEKELFFSIHKTYDLYIYLLLLIVDIATYAENRIELAKEKKIPTHEDLNPNTRFINNSIIRYISNSKHVNSYLSENKISWVNHPELIKKLYNIIRESDIYKEYLEGDDYSLETDKKFIVRLLTHIIAQDELLYQVLEEESIYWNDDIEFVISIIAKSLKKIQSVDNNMFKLLPLFKDEEDEKFVKTLFRKTILNHVEYQEYINKFAKNWEVERIAFMDRLIMEVAIAEMIEFTSIPTRVSFNEYIEISKFYSTPKSGNFINGILDKIVQYLKKEKKIVKSGRGLIGEAE